VPWLRIPEDQLRLAPSLDYIIDYSESFETMMIGSIFRTCNAMTCAEHRDNPDWVDACRAVVVATTIEIGADLAVVLDLRVDPENPRVMAPAVVGEHTPSIAGATQVWLEVAKSLDSFIDKLGL